jgi:dCMP deaminase
MNKQEKWDRRFLELAKHISTWSKDPSSQVGAVVVDRKRRVVGMGYNGFPRGVTDDPVLLNDRKQKYPRVVHAEVNAMLIAGEHCEGSTIYVYPSFAIPNICSTCCGIAAQSGIEEVVGYEPGNSKEEQDRRNRPTRSDGLTWDDSIAISKQICHESKIRYRSIKVQPE